MLKYRILAIGFLLLGLIAGYFDLGANYGKLHAPNWLKFPFRLGLDLQGGTHLVYKANVSQISASQVADAMAGLRDVIERRVNLFGVTEPIIQVEKSGSENRLIVELAGVFDINQAIQSIGRTPYLEFRTLAPGADLTKLQASQQKKEPINIDDYFKPTQLTGRYLAKATLDFNQTSLEPTVLLDFNSDGGKLFADITRENISKPLAIFLDGLPIEVPTVREEITSGRAVISGSFTPETARTLVRNLNAGALPLPITLISQESVGASLGSAALSKMVRAGIFGTILVAIFLILFYRLPGIAATLALTIYVSLMLALFKLIPVTMSAAGIAGFILSIGMAVDANILIFERTREELRAGKSLYLAVEEGFARAWLSIRDSNVSSLITSIILYWFGTSIVQGFALTLGIGIAVSMFSALTVTRTFLRAFEFKEGKLSHMLFGVSK